MDSFFAQNENDTCKRGVVKSRAVVHFHRVRKRLGYLLSEQSRPLNPGLQRQRPSAPHSPLPTPPQSSGQREEEEGGRRVVKEEEEEEPRPPRPSSTTARIVLGQ